MKTAVDWLIDHWKKLQSDGEKMSWNQIIEITKIANEIHHKQVVDARATAPLLGSINREDYQQEAETYYQETYGK
jgi:hypothetical protein